MASEMLKKALLASAHEEYLKIDKLCEPNIWEPSEHFCSQMENLLQQTKKRHTVNIKRVLLVAAVIFLVSVTTVFSFATVREKVINFFKEYYYTHFDMEYGFDEPGDIVLGNGINTVYTFSSLPEGFKKASVTENKHSVTTIWENENGDAIILSQGDGITKRSIDVERLEKTEIVSNGTVFEIYTEENYILILWNTEEYTFSIDYYGEMKSSDIIEIAESLTGEEK